MENIEIESEIDELRPEYRRSDFGEFVRGAVTQVEIRRTGRSVVVMHR